MSPGLRHGLALTVTLALSLIALPAAAQSLTLDLGDGGQLTGRIVQRVAPMLGIAPDFSEVLDQNLVPAVLR